MAEPIVLTGKKRRTLTAPVFLAVVFAAALARGVTGAQTTSGRVAVVVSMGTLLAVTLAYAFWIVRNPPERLEIGPDGIVWFLKPGHGIRLGTAPPIHVRRVFIGQGTNRTTTWVLRDTSGTATRFRPGTETALDTTIAEIDLTAFHPDAVVDALARAGWATQKDT